MRLFLIIAPHCLAAQRAAARLAPETCGFWVRGSGNARVEVARSGGDTLRAMRIGDTSMGAKIDVLVMQVETGSVMQLEGTDYERIGERAYSSTFEAQENEFLTRGCVAGPLVGRDLCWTRAG